MEVLMRCKGCNQILSGHEMSRVKTDGSAEDLCSPCNKVVYLDLEDLYDYKDYAFGEYTENALSQLGYDFDSRLGLYEN